MVDKKINFINDLDSSFLTKTKPLYKHRNGDFDEFTSISDVIKSIDLNNLDESETDEISYIEQFYKKGVKNERLFEKTQIQD